MKRIREFFHRAASFVPPSEVIGITCIVVLSLFLRVTRIPAAPFSSDESLYSYASYAISQGVIPYREIQLAHPPFMYLINALFIRLSGPNLIYLRLWTIGINLANVFLVYLMVKVILRNQKGSKLGLISAGIYAFYPVISAVTSSLEAILTFFMLLSLIVYVKSYSSSRKTMLFLSGIFMGCALMTKLPAIFFIATILIYHLMYAAWRREYRRVFLELPIILLGIAVPLAFTLLWIVFSCGAFNQFYMQIFQWQVIRPPQLLSERLDNILWYANAFLPLIVIGALSLPYFAKKVKAHDNHLVLLPAILYGANIVGFLALSRFILFHYFIFLSPFLVFLGAVFLNQVAQIIKEKPRINAKPRFSFVFLLISAIILAATLVPILTARMGPDLVIPFVDNPYTKTEYYIGNYVAAITNQSDKIWTSEGSIAFFAQRSIATPNSSDWPVQAFFDDMFGVLSPSHFVQTWENEETKVVIFILGKGWVPYPDGYLWYGTSNSTGVASYIQEKYEPKKSLTL